MKDQAQATATPAPSETTREVGAGTPGILFVDDQAGPLGLHSQSSAAQRKDAAVKSGAAASANRTASYQSLQDALAETLQDDKASVTRQHDEALADVHNRFETERATLRARAAGDAAGLRAKAGQLGDTLRAEVGGTKKALDAEERGLVGRFGAAATTHEHELTASAADEAENLGADAGFTVGDLTSLGDIDGEEIGHAAAEGLAASDAIGARRGAESQLAAVGQVSVIGVPDAVADGLVRAEMAREAAGEAKGRIGAQATRARGQLHVDAALAAARISGRAKGSGAALGERAQAGTAAIEKVKNGEAAKVHEAVAGAEKTLDVDLADTEEAAAADLAASDRTSAAQVEAGLAELTEEESTAKLELDAELEARLAAVDRKGAAVARKLAAARTKDGHKLAQLLQAAMNDIDRDAEQAEKHLKAIAASANRRSSAELAKELDAMAEENRSANDSVDMLGEVALSQARRHGQEGRERVGFTGSMGQASIEDESTAQAAGLAQLAGGATKDLDAARQHELGTLEDENTRAKTAIAAVRGELDAELAGLSKVDVADARADASTLAAALGRVVPDFQAIQEVLADNQTPAALRALRAAYQVETGRALDKDLERWSLAGLLRAG